MATNAIEPGETRLLIPTEDTTEYYATLTGASVQLGRTEKQAKSDTHSRPGPSGDRGPMQAESNEEIWVHNPEENQNVAFFHLDHNGFWWNREARDTVASVLTSEDNPASPANDDDVHRFGEQVDVNAEAVAEAIEMPDAADSLVISCDDAAGSFGVVVEFLDSADGTVLTKRNKDKNPEYGGGASSDVYVEVTGVASPFVRVRIVDESGATNALDYSVYAR